MAEAMIEFIEEAAIPVAMVGLLYALPNTQLTRRLEREGRLHQGHDVAPTIGADQCTAGINFDPVRPLRDILTDYKRVLEHYEILAQVSPETHPGRCTRCGLVALRKKAA